MKSWTDGSFDNPAIGQLSYDFAKNGAWLSLVERSVRDREVVGSNPIAPTTFS